MLPRGFLLLPMPHRSYVEMHKAVVYSDATLLQCLCTAPDIPQRNPLDGDIGGHSPGMKALFGHIGIFCLEHPVVLGRTISGIEYVRPFSGSQTTSHGIEKDKELRVDPADRSRVVAAEKAVQPGTGILVEPALLVEVSDSDEFTRVPIVQGQPSRAVFFSNGCLDFIGRNPDQRLNGKNGHLEKISSSHTSPLVHGSQKNCAGMLRDRACARDDMGRRSDSDRAGREASVLIDPWKTVVS